jgi:hypothetical protein
VALFGALATVGVGLAPGAAVADAPYSVNLTQFSKQVRGVAPPGVTTVTVDLLRNTLDATGKVVRNQVDSFTASVGAGGNWSGSFVSHMLSGAGDQVEVNYTPTPNETDTAIGSPAQLTIGTGNFLPTATVTDADTHLTAQAVDLSADGLASLEGDVWISPGGSAIGCDGCDSGFSVSVDGGAPQAATSNPFTLTPSVSAGEPLEVTAPDPLAAENTQVTLSVPGPQLSLAEPPFPSAPAGTTGADHIKGLPFCSAYLVIDEVVCHSLTPGSYTLTDGSQSQQLTVPAAIGLPQQNKGDLFQSLFVPTEAGAAVTELAGGQTVTLSQDGRTLTSLTVDSLMLNSSLPLGDLLNGANATTTGTCSPGLYIQDSGTNPDLCTASGTLPTPNQLTGATTSLTENDETSMGSTTVMLPQFALQQPSNGASVFTPFQVTAQLRYTDPLAQMTQDNTLPPQLGAAPVIASTATKDQAVFSYAPLGSKKFKTLGNANVAGGVLLPATLPIGAYDGRWTVTDPAGNTYTRESVFYNQGARSGDLPAPKCSAKVHSAGPHDATFHCTAKAGAAIALWLQRGTRIVADGAGTARHGRATIQMAGPQIKRGTYQLIEILDLNGQSSQNSRTLKLK